MIGYIKGKATVVSKEFCFIEAGGIGYRVFISEMSRQKIHLGAPVRLLTYMAVREDAILLYGFLTQEEYDLFLILISVSKIGPKVAMGILSVMEPADFVLSIRNRNLSVLTKLPGVGRKTANVIQSVVFNKAAMAVDTHVFRVSHRIGLVPDSCTTPFSVEKELIKNIPEELIPIAHHWLILHGRYVCQARTPKCATCGLQMMCKYFCNTYKVTKEESKAKNK